MDGQGNSDRNRQGRRFVVGITGASGALYAQRLIQLLLAAKHEVHLGITPYGHRLLKDELGHEGVNVAALGGLPEGADPASHGLFYYPTRDVGAAIGSGSFRHDGMVIIPASSNTLNCVATGVGDTLVTRAAAVAPNSLHRARTRPNRRTRMPLRSGRVMRNWSG